MILRTRILALAALLTVLFLSLIGYTLYFFSAASSDLNRIVQRNLAVEKTTESLNSTILAVRSEIWDTMVFDLAHRADQVRRLDTQAEDFYRNLRDLSDEDPELAKTSGDLRYLFQRYYQFGSTILEMKSLEEFLSQGQAVQKFKQNQTDLSGALAQTLEVSKVRLFGALAKLNTDFSTTTVSAFSLAGGVTLLSFVIAVLMARRLTRPLERLTKTARKVAGGDYQIRPEHTSSGEIRDLTETFTAMLDQIENYSTRMEDLVRARTTALVRTNATMTKELKLAKKIQGALVPRQFPAGGPLSFAGAYLPMEDLGGDFYDVFEGTPGVWTLVMADVSGHGVPAALVTAMVKVSLGLHRRPARDPGQILYEVNRELCTAIGDLKKYVTMVLCVVDLHQNSLAYCNAGHNEFLVIRHEGPTETLGPNSGVVGLRCDELFLTRTIPFYPGDALVLFTDGLLEDKTQNRTPFSLGDFLSLVEDHRTESPADLVDRITGRVTEFLASRHQQDDIAVLAVRWSGAKAATETRHPSAEPPRHPSASPWAEAEDLYQLKDFEGLETWADRRLTAAGSSHETSRALHWKAMALHRQGRAAEAQEAWKRSLAADPAHFRARRNLDLVSRNPMVAMNDA